jgi:hypothetical protein
MMETKICSACGTEKELSLFVKHKQCVGGYAKVCKACDKLKKQQYYEQHKEELIRYRTQYNKDNERKAYRNLESRFNSLLKSAMYRNKFVLFIDVEFLKTLWVKQNGLCAYTKLPLVTKAHQLNTVSIDRIDSNVGYVDGNVQLVCKAVNKMKQEYRESDFLHLCHLIAQNNRLPDDPVNLAVNREQI